MKLIVSVMLLLSSVLLPTGYATAEIMDFSGKPAALSDYTNRGKWTTVVIWRSDCHVCNQEAEQYIQFYEAYKGKHIQVIGLSTDGQQKLAEAKAFIKRHDVTFPNLIGEPAEVEAMYEKITGGPWVGTPTILVYDTEGKLVAAQPGAVPTDMIEAFIEQRIAESPHSNSKSAHTADKAK